MLYLDIPNAAKSAHLSSARGEALITIYLQTNEPYASTSTRPRARG